MKKNLSILIMALTLVVISGCNHGLTLEDVTRAQGISWWDVNIPTYAQESASFGIAFRDEQGTVIPTSTMYLFRNIELDEQDKVRVIVWDALEPMIQFAVLWDDGGGVRSSVTNRFDTFNSPWNTGVNFSSSGNTVDLGEPLLSGCFKSEDRPQKKLHLILEKNIYKQK